MLPHSLRQNLGRRYREKVEHILGNFLPPGHEHNTTTTHPFVQILAPTPAACGSKLQKLINLIRYANTVCSIRACTTPALGPISYCRHVVWSCIWAQLVYDLQRIKTHCKAIKTGHCTWLHVVFGQFLWTKMCEFT